MYSNRYVYDALYGLIHLPDYVWETMLCPEVQRLREVRLCNINSLCLPGGANINRYEHAIGTVHLALQCLQNLHMRVDKVTGKRIVLAALLHDIMSAAFGHSVQYVLGNRGYEHESVYDIVESKVPKDQLQYCYQQSRFQPIFFGMHRRLPSLLNNADLMEIGQIVAGQGTYGPLISSGIDLDNIDNVYRLAYHIGLTGTTRVPIELANSIWSADGRLIIDYYAVDLLKDWYQVRRTLYRFLLLNPDEFSAKCMLQEALELASERSEVSFYWHDVDYQLLEKLANSTDEVAIIISRLMVGDLYGCLGIYSTSNTDAYAILSNSQERRKLEMLVESQVRKAGHNLYKKANVGIHVIKDVNKTERQVRILTSKGKEITIGTPSSRLLVGVFLKNVHFSMHKIKENTLKASGIQNVVRNVLGDTLVDKDLEEIEPYGESTEAIPN